ncbi:Major facilitator super domain-containing protein 10 [Clonorchis sinensis]|uniref:Major facilitator super domain-containing protein 10 n=1 Tax=Clonorchis sinensis TaxID=79923 RepID=A0A8T1MFD9_CLOSI|nr:Major facilitator super domain-containing protein 10 [Clonorchis sinensis]
MHWSSIFAIFVYLLADVIAFSIILPWFPTIFAADSQDVFHTSLRRVSETINSLLSIDLKWNSAIFGGAVTSTAAVAQFFSSPFAGALSDVYGRKRILISLQALSILAYLLCAQSAFSYPLFAVSRLLCGITRANVAVLSALIGDQCGPDMRTRAMTLVGAAYSVGYTLGPPTSVAIMGRLMEKPVASKLLQYLGLSATILEAFGLLVIVACVSEPEVKHRNRPVQLDTTFRLLDPRNLFSFQGVSADKKVINRLWEWSIIWFVFLLIFSGLESTVLFLTRSRFGFTGRDQGHIFLFLGIVMLIVQGGLVHRFRHGNEAKVSSLAIFVLALAALIIGTSQLWWVFYIGLAFWGFSSASFMPTFNGMVSLQTGPERQGQVLGVFRSLNALARAVGPFLFSLVFGVAGPTCSYVIAAASLICIGVHYVRTNTLLKQN